MAGALKAPSDGAAWGVGVGARWDGEEQWHGGGRPRLGCVEAVVDDMAGNVQTRSFGQSRGR